MVIVRDYMRKEVSTLSSEESAFEASRAMLKDKVCYVIVLDRVQLTGIVANEGSGLEGYSKKQRS